MMDPSITLELTFIRADLDAMQKSLTLAQKLFPGAPNFKPELARIRMSLESLDRIEATPPQLSNHDKAA